MQQRLAECCQGIWWGHALDVHLLVEYSCITSSCLCRQERCQRSVAVEGPAPCRSPAVHVHRPPGSSLLLGAPLPLNKWQRWARCAGQLANHLIPTACQMCLSTHQPVIPTASKMSSLTHQSANTKTVSLMSFSTHQPANTNTNSVIYLFIYLFIEGL